MSGWMAPRDGGYHGGDGYPAPPPPDSPGAASAPRPQTPAEVQADVVDACTRFLEIAAGVRASALNHGFPEHIADHMAMATYASMAAHL